MDGNPRSRPVFLSLEVLAPSRNGATDRKDTKAITRGLQIRPRKMKMRGGSKSWEGFLAKGSSPLESRLFANTSSNK